MKIVYCVAALLCLMLPAKAEEDDNNPVAHLKRVIVCEAVNINLLKLHNEIAASVTVMSGDNPQVAMLRQSYLDLAKSDQERMDSIAKLAREVVLPEFREHADEVKPQIEELLSAQVQRIAVGLMTPDYDTQVNMQRALLEESGNCESFVEKLMQSHTY